MDILILGGFLGSGKTTLLMELASHLAAAPKGAEESGAGGAPQPIRVVILENEVGSQGVDDGLLRSSGFSVENLFAGCACCTVGTELIQAVTGIEQEYHPDWMILETTGLAYPGLIRENLKSALGKESRICTVVDAARWRRLRGPMAELLRGQIACADVILANKADLAPADALEECMREIRELNAEAPILPVSALKGVNQEVWDQVLGKEGIE